MRRALAEHIASTLVVALVFGALIVFTQRREAGVRSARGSTVVPYLRLRSIDFGNRLHRAIFRETLAQFRPDSVAANEALLRSIDTYREALFTDPTLKTGADERTLSWPVVDRLLGMYAVFIAVFVAVLFLTLYAAQGMALYRFVLDRQGRGSALREFWDGLRGPRSLDGQLRPRPGPGRMLVLLLKALCTGLMYCVLFSPAYVIGYALKTKIETDNLVFMVFLGVLSNGLLITYANKFFTLLVTESRKGYVETALAKGLSGRWTWNVPGGIRAGSLFRFHKRFPSHVLDHIFLNARFQYLPTLKEQGSFLITGLIIIEMALNIQGHLGYELLQRVLYMEYDIVLAITFGIFLIVKATSILVDWRWIRESNRYENVRTL